MTIILFGCSSRPDFNENSLSKEIIIKKEGSFYSIIPKCYDMSEAFIFYPGGLVDPEAYLPLLVRISKELNIAVFISKMPFNLAIMGQNRAYKILKKYNYIDRWSIGGHSLGGVIASSFVFENPKIFNNLILMASYPMDKKPINDIDINVLSINASEDGLVTKDKIVESADNLPVATIFEIIDGGNHAQFGSYGEQQGDKIPKITREQQHIQIVRLFKDFLR